MKIKMTAIDFRQQYMCDCTPNKRDKALWNLANTYNEECDAFDDKVCTGRKLHGELMPGSN